MKRSGKFYRKNEAEIMQLLGLQETRNSGAGWIEKEDGQNDNVICQLKSTDKQSIKISKQDIETLEYNAGVCHKLPVFAVNFLADNSIYLLIKPQDLKAVTEYINTGGNLQDNTNAFLGLKLDDTGDFTEQADNDRAKPIKSNRKAREAYRQAREKQFDKIKKAR